MLVQPDRAACALASVSKGNGRVLGMLDVGHDSEPIHHVAVVTGIVFYRANASTVTGFRP